MAVVILTMTLTVVPMLVLILAMTTAPTLTISYQLLQHVNFIIKVRHRDAIHLMREPSR
jgi:hypothetical protein